MATEAAMAAVPDGMREVYLRFERWRSEPTGRLPIPEDLWASAAEVAKEQGVFRTAKCLRLEYGKRKKLAQSSPPVPRTTAPDLSGLSRVFWEPTRRGTSIRVLAYDGQGFWLAQKRLSPGRFVWWPSGSGVAQTLEAHQAQLLLAAGNPAVEAAPMWRRVS